MLKPVPVAALVASIPALLPATRQQQPGPATAASLQRQLQAKFNELDGAGTFPGRTAGFVLADGSSVPRSTGKALRAIAVDLAAIIKSSAVH